MRILRTVFRKISDTLHKDREHNLEDYANVALMSWPILLLTWPAFGYLWISDLFKLYDNMYLRWFFGIAYATLGILASKKRTGNYWYWSWWALTTLSMGIYPWYVYLETGRSDIWMLSLIFFSVTLGFTVRGLDAILSALASIVLVLLIFIPDLVLADLAQLVVQLAVLLTTQTAIAIFRNQKTQIKKQAHDLELANAVLRRNERRKDEFIARVAHELRNPISIITSVSLDIIEDPETSRKVRKRLKLMQYGVERADRMLGELLDLERFVLGVASLSLEPHNVEDYGTEVLRSLMPTAKVRGIAFGVNVSPGLKAVFDRSRMNHVVYNLVDNSFKFAPRNTGAVVVDIYAAGSDLCLRVRDNGRGISEENLELIFVRYFQEESQRGSTSGAGIGLSLVKEVVEAHKGNITVKSKLGVGTQFDIVIPDSVIP